jgi:hypothetical protein
MIWSYEDGGYLGLIVGCANDGISRVPGVLRVTVESEDGKPLKSGCLDPGYPLPGKVRQAQFVLPQERGRLFLRGQCSCRRPRQLVKKLPFHSLTRIPAQPGLEIYPFLKLGI